MLIHISFRGKSFCGNDEEAFDLQHVIYINPSLYAVSLAIHIQLYIRYSIFIMLFS